MLQFVRELLTAIFADAIAPQARKSLFLLRSVFGTKLSRYRHDLRDQLRMMPFIYADLQGDVLNDFVEIEIHTLDSGTSRFRDARQKQPLPDHERLKRSRRVIFLGDAGIGKTTYQRYAILSLLRNPAKARFVYPGESLIPIYIPLKLLDNSEAFPVIRFLLRAHPLFEGSGGVESLRRLATRRRLFLFLDGYDEISADRDTNHLRAELTVLFGTTMLRTGTGSQDELGAVALNLRSCRMWLSSRREFFEQHAIPVDSNINAGPDTMAAVEVLGVGRNRLRLAKNIFNKYRRREHFYEELLNEEYFISEIDRSLDDDVKAISFNPLFLTIMCYVYASEVAKRKRYDVDWLQKGFEALVMECIRLLLVDLDESKARDMPVAHREGLLRRRNEFIEEKEAFLTYFAAELLFDGTGAFTLEDLRASVITFFESEQWPRKDQILGQMHDVRSGRPDFALQLIYSGVFTSVIKIDKDYYYDFPHRRFRETLALRYVTTAPRYCRALLQVDRIHFEEFLRLLKQSDVVQQRDFQVSALQHTLQAALHDGRAERDIATSRNLFRVMPPGMTLAPELKTWLLQMIGSPTPPPFELSRSVLLACKDDLDLANTFVEAATESVAASAGQRFALAIRALELAWPRNASEILRRHWREMSESPAIRIQATQATLAVAMNMLPGWIERCELDEGVANDFFYASTRAMSKEWTDESKWNELWKLLPNPLRARWLGFVTKFAPNQFEGLCKSVGSEVNAEWLCVLSLMRPHELDNLVSLGAPIYVSTKVAELATEQRIQDLKTIFVRAKVPGRSFNERLSNDEPETDIDILPLNFAATLELVREELSARRGQRIDDWPRIAQGVRDGATEWLRKLTRSSNDPLAPTNRQEVKAAQLGDWLIQSIGHNVKVSAKTLKTLEPATAAWSYDPRDFPGFFS